MEGAEGVCLLPTRIWHSAQSCLEWGWRRECPCFIYKAMCLPICTACDAADIFYRATMGLSNGARRWLPVLASCADGP